jgi:hypothetical protein
MRKIIFLFIAIPLINFALTSCDPAKRIAKKKAKIAIINSDLVSRLSVSFISIGSGTDSEAKQKFEKFLSDYEAKNKTKLTYETVKWGREGEVDYCFKLEELKAKQQEKFIKELKDVLKDSKLVRYTENMPCKKR